jgi:DNA excision repair protein ERCC-2
VAKEALSKKLKEIDEKESLASELRDFGVEYVQSFPQGRSHLISVANFLERWQEKEPSFVRIVKRKDRGVALQVKALDPGIVSGEIFGEVHSAILMSGTLLPTKMYADLLGIPEERAVMKEYSSPFPKENKLSLVVPTVTTKYSERSPAEFEKISAIVSSVANNIPGNSAVFFPSFGLLEAIAPLMEGILSRPMLKQKREMNSREKAELLKRFRQQGTGFGAVLMAVASGSFAEGIDYMGEQLLGAIIVGIPLNEMDLETECLIDYYQKKFGAGWHYGYLYPAVARAIQASGRVIRDRTDRGVVVFMDKRYTWENYRKCFPKDFEKIVTGNPEKLVEEFWNKKESGNVPEKPISS